MSPKGKRGIFGQNHLPDVPQDLEGGLVGEGERQIVKQSFWPDSHQGPPCTTEDRSSSPAAR